MSFRIRRRRDEKSFKISPFGRDDSKRNGVQKKINALKSFFVVALVARQVKNKITKMEYLFTFCNFMYIIGFYC